MQNKYKSSRVKANSKSNADDKLSEETAVADIDTTDDLNEEVVADHDDISDDTHKLDNPSSFMSEDKDYDVEYVHLPAVDTDTTIKNLNSTVNMKLKENVKTAQWAYTLSNSHQHNTIDDRFINSLHKGSWGQGVKTNVGVISGSKAIAKALTNQRLEGKDAVLRMLSFIGGSGSYNNVLWKSCLWFEIDPITDTDILKLYRDLTKDTIELGRYSHGSVFSNTSVYTAERVVKFILSKLGTHSYRGDKDLGDIIKLSDLPILINSLISTMYPHGYNYNRSCAASPKTCHATVSGSVNSSKSEWIDRSMLGEYNIKALSKSRDNACNDETLIVYNDSLICDSVRVVEVEVQSGAVIKVTLKDPTFNEYITAGRLWLDNIVTQMENGLETDDIDERNNIISDAAKATTLRQYAHFIDKLEYGDGIESMDTDTINDILDNLSGDKVFKEALIGEIQDFIDHTTIGIVAIPTYKCDKCGNSQSDIDELLPIDQLMLFFNLCTAKVQSIQQTTV